MKRSYVGVDLEEIKFSDSNPPGLVDTEDQAESEPLKTNSLSDGNKNTRETTSGGRGDNQTATIEGPSNSAQHILEVPRGEEQNLVLPQEDKGPHSIPQILSKTQTDIESNRAENANAEGKGVRQSDSSLNATEFPETIYAGGMTGRWTLSGGSGLDESTEHPTKNRLTVSIPTESNEYPEFVDAGVADDEVHDNSSTFTYMAFDKHKLKYFEVIGLLEQSQLSLFLEDFGVEQMTVYSREFANK
jgi:hypothetical protein